MACIDVFGGGADAMRCFEAAAEATTPPEADIRACGAGFGSLEDRLSCIGRFSPLQWSPDDVIAGCDRHYPTHPLACVHAISAGVSRPNPTLIEACATAMPADPDRSLQCLDRLRRAERGDPAGAVAACSALKDGPKEILKCVERISRAPYPAQIRACATAGFKRQGRSLPRADRAVTGPTGRQRRSPRCCSPRRSRYGGGGQIVPVHFRDGTPNLELHRPVVAVGLRRVQRIPRGHPPIPHPKPRTYSSRSTDRIAASDASEYPITSMMPVLLVPTHRELAPAAATVRAASGDIASLIAEAKQLAGDKDVYLDGGDLIRQGLDAQLVDELCITWVPIVLGGDGVRLFDGLRQRARLAFVDHQRLGNMIQVTARPIRSAS